MTRNTRLKSTAVKIGTAVGKADRTAHKIARATQIARVELIGLMKQVESLKRELEKSSKRLKRLLR